MTDAALSPARLVAGKYRLGRVIGQGGMGIVHAAEHVALGTPVAVKLLQPKLRDDASARARFLREAQRAAAVIGEHSTRIFDVGTTDHDDAYLAMELLEGETAESRLERTGALSVEDAATVMLQLLDALAEAHAKGLVHRDLKPSNVFLVDKPGERIWVKVLDFGIAKQFDGRLAQATSATSATLTEPNTVIGSPQYMSPEQLRDAASVDARSDIWSCGVLLYQLLTTKLPFDAPSIADLFVNIVREPHRSLAEAGAHDVPAAMARIVDRCLRKEAVERPRSAHDLAVALAPHASARARALLPRIRAWCNADDAEAESAASRRGILAGVSLVAFAGALAFAVASADGAARTAHVEPLRPVVASLAPMPTAASSATPSASAVAPVVAPSAMAPAQAPAVASTPARTKTVPKAAPSNAPPPHVIKDLRDIDLLP